jgi:phage I-like protein
MSIFVQLSPVKLSGLTRLAVGADVAVPLPTRLLVFPWGENHTNQGLFIVNEVTANELVANQVRMKFDIVALDYQHNTAPVTDAAGNSVAPEVLYGTPRQVAGFSALDVVRPGGAEAPGIYMTSVAYNPGQEEIVRSGAYPDLSPTPLTNERREVIFLHSVALCRQGEVDGVVFPIRLSAELAEVYNNTNTNNKQTMNREQLLALLASMGVTNLAADITDEALLTRVNERGAELQALAAATPAPTPPAPATPPAPVDAANETLSKLEARIRGMECDTILRNAASQGKVIGLSAEVVATMTPTQLQAVVDAAQPGRVPTSPVRGSGTAATPPAGGLTMLSSEIAKNLGLVGMKEEKRKELAGKYHPTEAE